MMKDPQVFLQHIIECIKNIEIDTKNYDAEKFIRIRRTQDAVLRNLEIMGEAVKNLPDDLKREHPEVSWKKVARFRDILIHFYFGVDLNIVWNVVREDLPELKKNIEKILKEIQNTKDR